MHATGIIAEYNPFHNGHAYQAAEARNIGKDDIIVAVMSGHITQRGEIALFDKWSRAASAVASGVDLVFELPAVFAARSAQHFAVGGVRLLASLGIVNHLSFGAETADLPSLANAASGLSDPEVIQTLKDSLAEGKTYAAALSAALTVCGHTCSNFITSPNNILGVEYVRAIHKYAPELQPLPIGRVGSDYHSTGISSCISSATAIRRNLLSSASIDPVTASSIPPTAVAILSRMLAEGSAPADSTKIDAYVLATLRGMNNHQLRLLPECSEGLENRLIKSAAHSGTVSALLEHCKSRRYPYSRLQRIIAHLLLGTSKLQLEEFDNAGPLYARVLAFNKQGRTALRNLSRHATIPLINKTSKFLNSRTLREGALTPLQSMLAFDITATDMFSLCLPNPAKRIGGLDFINSAIYVEKT